MEGPVLTVSTQPWTSQQSSGRRNSVAGHGHTGDGQLALTLQERSIGVDELLRLSRHKPISNDSVVRSLSTPSRLLLNPVLSPSRGLHGGARRNAVRLYCMSLFRSAHARSGAPFHLCLRRGAIRGIASSWFERVRRESCLNCIREDLRQRRERQCLQS